MGQAAAGDTACGAAWAVGAGAPFELRHGEGGLTLVSGGLTLTPDLSRLAPRLRPDRLSRELLVRACRVRGVPHPRVVDATAGLGEDALLLAAAGCEVTLFESDPVVFALLEDSLRRAADDARLAEAVVRMRAVRADSTLALREMGERGEAPDVVYLDPMFPERRKSAAVKKKFQLIHLLQPPCEAPEELLAASVVARPRKVVVKRPLKGPALAGVAPSHSLAGKAIRFDVIVPASPARLGGGDGRRA